MLDFFIWIIYVPRGFCYKRIGGFMGMINFMKHNVRIAQWVVLLSLVSMLIIPGKISHCFVFISVLTIIDIVIQICNVRRTRLYLLFEMVLYGSLILCVVFDGLRWGITVANDPSKYFISMGIVSLCIILLLLVILFFNVLAKYRNNKESLLIPKEEKDIKLVHK